MKEKAKKFYKLSKTFCDYVLNNPINEESFKYILEEKLSDYDPTPSVFRGDLKDILEDLLYGNVLYEKGKIEYALHEWKQSCLIHWGGSHAMGLFSAIHAKLMDKYLNGKM